MNNAICLVIDRLQSAYLGCYGNSWIVTPGFNRLAAEGFVCDQALVDSASLGDLYQAYWQGSHVLERRAGKPAGPSLPLALGERGIATTLLTDEPALVLPGDLGDRFERIDLALTDATEAATEIEETRLASFFASAMDWLESASDPFCLWLHTRGLGAPWDAPLEYRNRYADVDEPLPPESVEVPSLLLPVDYDPDERLGIAHAYAGQVSLLDQALATFCEALKTSRFGSNTLLVMVGARGLALGEHRRIGAWDDALSGETVHIPWLVRHPNGLGAASRSQALVQPPDLAATLLDWWQIPGDHRSFARSILPIVRDEAPAWRDRICLASAGGERAIRTPGWYLRLSGQSMGDEPDVSRSLFTKPDDRFEANDVATRCPEIADQLEQSWLEFDRLAKAGELEKLSLLEERVLAGLS